MLGTKSKCWRTGLHMYTYTLFFEQSKNCEYVQQKPCIHEPVMYNPTKITENTWDANQDSFLQAGSTLTSSCRTANENVDLAVGRAALLPADQAIAFPCSEHADARERCLGAWPFSNCFSKKSCFLRSFSTENTCSTSMLT